MRYVSISRLCVISMDNLASSNIHVVNQKIILINVPVPYDKSIGNKELKENMYNSSHHQFTNAL